MVQGLTSIANDFLGNPRLIESQSNLELALSAIVRQEMAKVNEAMQALGVQTFNENGIAAHRDEAVNDALQSIGLPPSKNTANAGEIPAPVSSIAPELNDRIQASLRKTTKNFISDLSPEVRQKLEQQRIGNELFNDTSKITTKEETQFVISARRQSVKDDLTNGGTIPITPELKQEIKREQKNAVENFYKHAPQPVKDFLKDIQSEKKHVTQLEVQNERNDGLYFVDNPKSVQTGEQLNSALNAIQHYVNNYMNPGNTDMNEARQKQFNVVLASTVSGFLNRLSPETQQNLNAEIQQVKDIHTPKPKEQPVLEVVVVNEVNNAVATTGISQPQPRIEEQKHKPKTGLEGVKMSSTSSLNGSPVQGAEVASGGQVKGA